MEPEAATPVWITGATGGLGREIALLCAARGARLALSARSEPALLTLAEDCMRAGSAGVTTHVFDVRDPDAIAREFKVIVDAHGSVRGFVATAGDVPLGGLETLTREQWEYGIANKLLATVHCLRLVLLHMRSQGRGRAVVLSGMRGREPAAGALLAGAVNAAINNVVKGVSREFARHGVAVNAVSPSVVMTPRGRLYVDAAAKQSGRDPEAIRAEMAKDAPSGRLVTPAEVATVVYELLFVFPESFTGNTVHLDGGESRGTL